MIASITLAFALQQQSAHQVVSGITAQVAPSRQQSHRVAPGETLGRIAPAMGESWQQLYAANKSVIGADPNLIYPGELLHARSGNTSAKVAALDDQAVRRTPGIGSARGTYGHPYYCGDGDGDGYDISCPALHRSSPAPAPRPNRAPRGSYRTVSVSSGRVLTAGDGSFQACVITRESGGNPRAVNAASGAGGLYQFLPSTWQALGHSGLPENASVAEQNQAFAQAYAQDGAQPWAPSDGC